jgi:hypothetical protein
MDDMKPVILLTLALQLVGPPAWATVKKQATAGDPRHIDAGYKIPDKGYCDQPYVVITRDGNWLCTLTTGKGHEGAGGQHVVATISRDQGKSWGPLIDIEPATGPEASWVVPLVVPSGRVYAIYTYNGDNIRTLPDSTKKIRADTHGWYAFKYSDDHGKTWSRRHRIPIRVTAADRANQWKGKVQHFWGIDKPKISADGVRFAFTKLGRYFLANGEGWMMYSRNILTEADPKKINWQLLPDGEHGIRAKPFGSVQEEHNHVSIGGGKLYMVYRTTNGYPCHSYSHDGGRTWTKPEHMTYSPGGRKIKNPRACPKIWQCDNGKYLFWFHNHSGKSFRDRNPAWVVGGVVRDGKMHWSQPEILLYSHDLSYQTGRMSYPDLIEQDGKYWVTATQKTIARVHPIDPTLLEGMWAQLEGKGELTRDGLVLSVDKPVTQATRIKMPRLPDLSKTNSGFALDMRLAFKDITPGQVILDSRDDKGKGIALMVAKDGAVKLQFSDGKNKPGSWTSDPGLLRAGQMHHITVIIDGGPNIITFVVDGQLCDGGTSRQYGWGRFDAKISDVNGSDRLRLSPSFAGQIAGLRIYDRALRTSQAVANYQSDARGRDAAGAKQGTKPTMHQVAVKAARPAGAPQYADVCFRYGWVRTGQFPTVADAKKAMLAFHATRVDWFYPGSHTADPGADYVTKEAKAFIDWCHANGMKVGGAINTLTTHKPWNSGARTNMGRYRGDPNNPEFVAAAVAWGKAQIDAGVDTLVCDDLFGYRSAKMEQLFSDNVIAKIKAHKKGFTIAGNNGGFMDTRYVKRYAFDFHYSDNNFVPTPGRWWAESKAHRALKSAILLHPNRPISQDVHRQMIALGYANGAHVITPWDEYIHGKERLFADPADFADLYAFVRALGQAGYLNGYEDAAVGGYDLKENRYGNTAPITVTGGSGKLSVFARAKPGEAKAPVVLHLVESSKGEAAKLSVQTAALSGSRDVTCTLLTPMPYNQVDHKSAAKSGKYQALLRAVALKAIVNDGKMVVDIPPLSPWGVLVVRATGAE